MAENTFSVEQWLVNMVQNGKAEVTEDGGFKINPDYYKELPRNDRHVESMTEAQALTVMQALTAAGIEFSAAARGEDKVGITVSKKDVVALSDIMQESVGKTADRYREDNSSSKSAERYQAINPEYYQSLGSIRNTMSSLCMSFCKHPSFSRVTVRPHGGINLLLLVWNIQIIQTPGISAIRVLTSLCLLPRNTAVTR